METAQIAAVMAAALMQAAEKASASNEDVRQAASNHVHAQTTHQTTMVQRMRERTVPTTMPRMWGLFGDGQPSAATALPKHSAKCLTGDKTHAGVGAVTRALRIFGITYRLRRCRRLLYAGRLAEMDRVSAAVDRDLRRLRT